MKLQAGPDDRGLRLDVFLARHLQNLTRSQIQLLNRSGAIAIDGRQDKSGYRIRGGETVDLALGLLVVEKNNVAHARLSAAFHDRKIQKTYLALVHGKPRRETATIELAVRRHPTIRTKMAAGQDKGRAAYTEYKVLEYFRGFTFL